MKPFKLVVIICFCLFIACNNSNKTPQEQPIINLKQQRDCVTSILKQDDSLGTVRNHNCETISLSKTIAQYVNSVNNLNYENCTEEFEIAFKNHMIAWTEIQQVTDKYSNLRGEMHDLFDSIEKRKDSSVFKALLKNIWNTWEDVETAKSNAENL
ncbi:hypothetical protein FBALC1_05483 [Flavobacteriales bacterium ALC-1]|nr:hypothetical protein FBALC1_05483 [Flavobacteriales bacterium ALC-1]